LAKFKKFWATLRFWATFKASHLLYLTLVLFVYTKFVCLFACSAAALYVFRYRSRFEAFICFYLKMSHLSERQQQLL